MENIKKSIFSKVIAFMAIQVCVVSVAFSGIIIVFNAGYGWYSSGNASAREDILQEVAVRVECEIHDRLYYHIEYSGEGEIVWSEYLLKDYDLPDGIGYKLELLKDKYKNIDDIKLQKNSYLSKSGSVYTQELYNDLYRLTVYVEDPLQVGEPASEIYPENLVLLYEFYNYVYEWRNAAVAVLVSALVLLSLLSAYMISSMKINPEKNNVFKKLPVDLMFCISAFIAVIVGMVISDVMYEACNEVCNYDLAVLVITAASLAISVVMTAFSLLFVYRVKCGKWWDNTVTCYVIRGFAEFVVWMFKHLKNGMVTVSVNMRKTAEFFKRGLRSLPVVWRTVVMIFIVMAVNLLITCNFAWSDMAQFFWLIGAIVISAGVIYIALCMKRLQKGARRLAEGDLNYKIETKGLFLDFIEHAENLNKIGDGMAVAVEERIRSERFKAELITNVSHDIKTPLTSIINYVDLLSKRKTEDSEIREYIDVLERQSNRLKKLTDDLVDASKASTGNVRMEMAPCKVGILMSQMMAEYKTKAEDNELEFILKTPDEDLEIFADGRRLWRVFDNLMNNICKYSQQGTRVYLTLEEKEGRAIITYRNISKYELDISEKELMERFVRGDKSRHTEGSGLGLSIARNLVELQNGTFDISIDGDLFKVVIEFDLLKF